VNVWPPEFGPHTIALHKANARMLRTQAFNAAFKSLFRVIAEFGRHAIALLASSRHV
jgi:hypothetical protein